MKNTLIRAAVLLMLVATIEDSFAVSAQKRVVSARAKTALIQVKPENAARISLETSVLPKKFTGHDAAVLFRNLTTLTTRNKGKIDGKTVYDNLTVDDYFAVSDYAISPAQGVVANDEDGSTYRGSVWRINSANDFPEPEQVRVDDCYAIGSGRNNELLLLSTRDKIFAPFEQSTDVWREGVFYLSTELPKTRRKDYKGYDIGKQCVEFYVPSKQIYYGLSFVRAQPLKLVEITDNEYETYHRKAFSLDDYTYKTVSGFGFAVWNGDDVVPQEKRESGLATLFVVKLAAPYISTKTFTQLDKVENKMHTAIQNKIYVDIVGVWLYNRATGEIVSKQTTDKP